MLPCPKCSACKTCNGLGFVTEYEALRLRLLGDFPEDDD